MIAGEFARDGSPYVNARVNLPRIGVVGNVNFLVDTGTDATIVHPFDAGNLHCPFDELSNPVVATSAGGQHTYYAEPAVVSFYDGETRHDFRTNIHIGKPHPITQGLDSLLGRDVLNELEMEYAPRRGRLRFRLDEDGQSLLRQIPQRSNVIPAAAVSFAERDYALCVQCDH